MIKGILPGFAFSGKIFFCKLHNLARKQEERNQVWDCHEAVEGLGNAPHQAKICGGAKDGNQRIGGHKIFCDSFGEQKLDAACTVKSPSENRGKGEATHRERGEQRNPVSVCKGKTADCQLCACRLSLGDVSTSSENNNCS